MNYDLHPHSHSTCKNAASEGKKNQKAKEKKAVLYQRVLWYVIFWWDDVSEHVSFLFCG